MLTPHTCTRTHTHSQQATGCWCSCLLARSVSLAHPIPSNIICIKRTNDLINIHSRTSSFWVLQYQPHSCHSAYRHCLILKAYPNRWLCLVELKTVARSIVKFRWFGWACSKVSIYVCLRFLVLGGNVISNTTIRLHTIRASLTPQSMTCLPWTCLHK